MTAKTVTNGEAWRRTLIGSATTLAISVGSMIGYLQVVPPRPDPHTGTQASARGTFVDYRLKTHEDRLMALEDRELPPPALLDRLNKLERKVLTLEHRMDITGP